jgi:hypothetical protein
MIARVRYPENPTISRIEPAGPPNAASIARPAAASARCCCATARPRSVPIRRSNSRRIASTRRLPSSVAATVRADAGSRRAAATSSSE